MQPSAAERQPSAAERQPSAADTQLADTQLADTQLADTQLAAGGWPSKLVGAPAWPRVKKERLSLINNQASCGPRSVN